jgi:hypothetical protein
VDIWTPDEMPEAIFDGYMDTYETTIRAEPTKVQIGRPEWWYVADLMGSAWKSPQGDDTYLLIRFSFSLEPPNGHEIEQVRLGAELRGPSCKPDPVAFDLFPLDVTEEAQRDVKLTFAPSLKLERIEASVGSAETTIHIARVQPVISALGLGTASPAWIMRRHPKHPLLGSRMSYAVIAYPSTAPEIEIQIGLTATVRAGRFGLWRLRTPETSQAALTGKIP